MANDLDLIQDLLREAPHNHHTLGRDTDPSLGYRVHELNVEKRRRADWKWRQTPEARRELAAYEGKYVYVADGHVVGHGDTASEAARVVEREFHIDPLELLGLMIPPGWLQL